MARDITYIADFQSRRRYASMMYVMYVKWDVTLSMYVHTQGANLTCHIIMHLIQMGVLKNTRELRIQWDGASENVNKTNWRFLVWLLLQKTGLTKIRLQRLIVGHTHYDVDQLHSVFSRKCIGCRRAGSVRKDAHSLSQYSALARYVMYVSMYGSKWDVALSGT